MPAYYIKISGSAWGIEATTKEAAINEVKKIAHVYCHFTALEIGKDVDDNGYPLPTGQEVYTHLKDRQ